MWFEISPSYFLIVWCHEYKHGCRIDLWDGKDVNIVKQKSWSVILLCFFGKYSTYMKIFFLENQHEGHAKCFGMTDNNNNNHYSLTSEGCMAMPQRQYEWIRGFGNLISTTSVFRLVEGSELLCSGNVFLKRDWIRLVSLDWDWNRN